MVQVAMPVPLSGTDAQPEMAVVLSVNVTVPVGETGPAVVAVTVAVNVTGLPKTEGFDEEPTAVAVAV